jgi:hypothetical protein
MTKAPSAPVDVRVADPVAPERVISTVARLRGALVSAFNTRPRISPAFVAVGLFCATAVLIDPSNRMTRKTERAEIDKYSLGDRGSGLRIARG